MTLKHFTILKNAKKKLKKCGITTYRIDAQILLSKILNLDNIGDLLFKEPTIVEDDYNKFKILLNRRLQHEPIAYIIGSKNFWKQDYIINRDVLIPRPETELIIELVLQKFTKVINKQLNILDLGTGSGCIILSLLSEFKLSIGVGVDRSKKALQIATINAANLNINNRVKFVLSNWFDNLNYRQKFDIIVSNPPYISNNEWISLERSVKNFEPKKALTDSKDGLESYRIIEKNVLQFLKKGGILILEIGYNQQQIIQQIFKSTIYRIKFYQDLQNIVRVAMINKY